MTRSDYVRNTGNIETEITNIIHDDVDKKKWDDLMYIKHKLNSLYI